MTARRLLTALLMALVGSALFTLWISRRFSKPVPAATAKQQYVAAAHDLEPGQLLQKQNLAMVEWGGAKLDGAFVKPEELVGRTILYPMAANQPILARQLAAAGSGVGLTTRIPDGMRAISLKTDQIVGVAGFLLPGTHVDVLVTYRTTTMEPVTATVLQDAEIVAAGQKLQPDPEGKPTTVDVVTLLVKPNDAERVTLASTQGTVHFILRNGSDHVRVDEKPVQLAELGGGGAVKAAGSQVVIHKMDKPLQPAAQVYTVQTVAGGKQTSESFQ